MRLLFILLPLLSFAATSVLAGEQIGADPDGNPIYANNDGKLIFCDKPNYGGACSAETIFMVEQCYHIPDPDTKGGPGSSWRVSCLLLLSPIPSFLSSDLLYRSH